MFDHRHYIPVLKNKAGELRAVDSAHGQGTQFTPFFELSRTDITPEASVDGLRKVWHATQPVFVDALYMEQPGAAGDDAINQIGFLSAQKKLDVIPVTGIARSLDQRKHVGTVAAAHGHGACVRLTEEDIETPDEIDQSCLPLLGEMGLGNADIHAIIDLNAIVASGALLRRLVADAV